ncbi:hypothetical protein AB0D42_38850 [Streptomyces sp. NPDC048304]|uniref:hypothetical protein n=1 Tax=Streptomyces sp. NPDC048304 TaxID=3154820 RepID=UPI0033DFF186
MPPRLGVGDVWVADVRLGWDVPVPVGVDGDGAEDDVLGVDGEGAVVVLGVGGEGAVVVVGVDGAGGDD